MYHYYINKKQQTNGDFEVHREGCSHPPFLENRIALGNFNNCEEAVKAAKLEFPNEKNSINGCYWCSRPCHTQ